MTGKLNLMNAIRRNKYLSDFFALVFPVYCPVCRQKQILSKEPLCLDCLSDIELTGFSDWAGNPMEQGIQSLAAFEQMTALFYFNRFGKTQRLIHGFKYEGNTMVGSYLSHWLAYEMNLARRLARFDAIIPVPMHPEKEKIRGFNQAEVMARAMADSLHLPYRSDLLSKTLSTSSQTKRNRSVRVQKKIDEFKGTPCDALEGKHVLLVDDIVTSGGTASACFSAIKKEIDCKISLASLGYTE